MVLERSVRRGVVEELRVRSWLGKFSDELYEVWGWKSGDGVG